MKKLLSLVLAFVLLFSFASCGKEEQKGEKPESAGSATSSTDTVNVFATPRTVAATGGVTEKRTLANTYKCLTVDKELDVLYIGGSLTQGAGSIGTECWRAYTTNWFKEAYPDAKITEIDASLGGTGSLWGLARTKREVVAKNPDLVFIEFAINDLYLSLTREQAAAYMEGMVRQINSALPNTDIIFVLTTDETHLGQKFNTLLGHIDIAEFYGIPYINVGDALIEPVKAASWGTYAADNVHLKSTGYRIYADEVIKNLKALLAEAKGVTAAEHTLPENYASSNPADTVTVKEADEITELNPEQWRFAAGKGIYSKNKGCTLPRVKDAVLKLEFDGSVLCLFGDKSAGSEIIFKIDGVEVKTIESDYEKYREIIGVDNLAPGHHTAEITFKERGIKLDALIIG